MLTEIMIVGLIKKQAEKAVNDPADMKESDLITIVTAYPELHDKYKSEDVKTTYDAIEAEFNTRGLKKFPEFA